MPSQRRMRIDVYLRSDPTPTLEAMSFDHPQLDAPRHLKVGIGVGGLGRRTAGTRALVLFLIYQRVTARPVASAPGGFESEWFSGGRSSEAASVNYALTRRPRWLLDLFGSNQKSALILESYVNRHNRDFKVTASGPLGLRLTYGAEFLPSDIRVLLDDRTIEPVQELEDVFEAIRNRRVLPSQPPRTQEPHSAQPPSLTDDPRSVCPPAPRLFVGREDLLRQVDERLCAKMSPDRRVAGMLVLRGWPGIGKSTLAAGICHSPRVQEFFSDGILWGCLGPSPDMVAVLAEWAAAQSIRMDHQRPDALHLSHRVAAAVRSRRLLVVVDDVWDAAHCAPLMITGPRGFVVCTTRLPEVAAGLCSEPSAILVVPPLSEPSALELLSSMAPSVPETEPRLALELVRSVECLPLAIRVAGRLLAEESRVGWGVRELLDSIRSDSRRLLDEPSPVDAGNLLSQASPTVAALLRRSTDRLPSRERMQFARLGALASQPATFDLRAMAAIWRLEDARPTARLLMNRGLIEPVGDRFQLHALLAAHARRLWDEPHVGSSVRT